MRLVIHACVLVALAACGGDDTPTIDAPQVIDAPPLIDAPPARVCNGQAYDPCTDTAGSSDCMAGLECRFYMMSNFTICSPTCGAAMPCPNDENGAAVACNGMGRCKSNAPNTCTPP